MNIKEVINFLRQRNYIVFHVSETLNFLNELQEKSNNEIQFYFADDLQDEDGNIVTLDRIIEQHNILVDEYWKLKDRINELESELERLSDIGDDDLNEVFNDEQDEADRMLSMQEALVEHEQNHFNTKGQLELKGDEKIGKIVAKKKMLETKEKIKEVVKQMIKNNEEITVSTVKKKSGLSYNTVNRYLHDILNELQ